MHGVSIGAGGGTGAAATALAGAGSTTKEEEGVAGGRTAAAATFPRRVVVTIRTMRPTPTARPPEPISARTQTGRPSGDVRARSAASTRLAVDRQALRRAARGPWGSVVTSTSPPTAAVLPAGGTADCVREEGSNVCPASPAGTVPFRPAYARAGATFSAGSSGPGVELGRRGMPSKDR